MYTFQTYLQEQEADAAAVTEKEKLKNIILYNDDINTFDHVIDMLVKVCNHDHIQAEQCAYLVHHSGKCAVKSGTYKELKPLCANLLEKGLTTQIE